MKQKQFLPPIAWAVLGAVLGAALVRFGLLSLVPLSGALLLLAWFKGYRIVLDKTGKPTNP